MNQMLKKASTTCAAFACAASLMFSGTALVWADGEMDDNVKTQVEAYVGAVTDEIIGLSDAEIEQYLEEDNEFVVNAMTAWSGAKKEVSGLKEISDTVEVEYDDKDKEYTATVEVEFEKEDADFVYVIDKKMNPTSLTVDVKYSFATIMKNAALNTLMGLGTVFVILAFLIFLISLFKFVPGSGAQQVKKKKEETPAPAPVPVAVPVQEEADDSELIAVIAAAIAASEGTTTDGFVVRSIRKINRKKR